MSLSIEVGTLSVCLSRFKNGTQLEPSDKVSMSVKPQNGDFVATLIFETTTTEDSGEIKAMAKNLVGEATSVSKLNVLGTE